MHVLTIQAWGLALLLIRLSVGNRELARARQSRPKKHQTAGKTEVSSRNQICKKSPFRSSQAIFGSGLGLVSVFSQDLRKRPNPNFRKHPTVTFQCSVENGRAKVWIAPGARGPSIRHLMAKPQTPSTIRLERWRPCSDVN